jgi:RNAse (barnase) inhibitor barstar
MNTSELHTVIIKEGTDLNALGDKTVNVSTKSIPSQNWDMGQMGHLPFPASLYKNLPILLRDTCGVLTSSTEQEVYLIGALGVISGILPNVLGHYDGRYIGPNLYVYVLAGYGIGKGGLEYARQLGAAIHFAKRNEYERAKKLYDDLKQEFERDKRAFNKGNSPEAPTLPTPPPNLMLYVPANSSKTGLYQLLHENEGRLVMFETERDTLADTLKQDYANFSDGLRKAFHHESISYFRRGSGNGGEYVEVNNPYLSLILSSTFDQLRALIPNPENGLFSRFLFYELEGTSHFKNVFDRKKRDYLSHFEQAGNELNQIYDHLNKQEKPLYFDFTESQQKRFLEQFQAWKTELREQVDAELDGTINRLGIICFRVAMVLTVLRVFEDGEISLICSDQDFDNALLIVKSLRSYALSVWARLPKTPDSEEEDKADATKAMQKRECRELRAKGLSVREISLQVFGTESKKSTVYRWTR